MAAFGPDNAPRTYLDLYSLLGSDPYNGHCGRVMDLYSLNHVGGAVALQPNDLTTRELDTNHAHTPTTAPPAFLMFEQQQGGVKSHLLHHPSQFPSQMGIATEWDGQ